MISIDALSCKLLGYSEINDYIPETSDYTLETTCVHTGDDVVSVLTIEQVKRLHEDLGKFLGEVG